MTIENSHYSMLTEAEKRARNLEAVLQISKTIASSLDLDHTLRATCQAAVELLNVDHSSLVLLSPGRDRGKVRAEYPEFGVLGLVIGLGGTKEHKRLGISTEPIFIPDVSNASELGAIRKILLEFNIQSILIVPVVNDNQVLGYFSLDTIGRTRAYTEEETDLCKIFAAQVAVAIKNAQLYEETKQRAEQLEAVRQNTLAITSELDRDALLLKIIDQAAGLLNAKNGGIFEYYPRNQELTVIIDSRGTHTGTTLRVGEGMAGRLVLSGEPFMIVDNYDEWPDRAPVEFGKRPSGAVLEVPLNWQNQLIGCLYVEDDVPRKFTDKDAQLLKLFADHAAIALKSTKLVKELEERQDNLASLINAAESLSGKVRPDQNLKVIAEQAKKILKGDSATIWPYDKKLDKFVTADLVTVGMSEAEEQEFRAQNPPSGGISRRVMREDWLTVRDVVAAVHNEFMRNTPRTELLIKMGIKSFQGVALKVGSEPVGVMFINYKKSRRFTDDDRRSMKDIATHVALALILVRNAQLFEERKQKLDEQEALVELSRQLLGTVEHGEILKYAVAVARNVLNIECGSIVLPGKDGRLLLVAQEGLVNVMVGETELPKGRRSQTGYIIETGKPSRVADYDKQEEFIPPEINTRNGIKSGMGVPMFREQEVIGAMLVHSRTHRIFTDDEENLLSLIANQTATALNNAEQIKRQEKYLSALLSASTSISQSGFDLPRILYEIVRQAFLCLSSAGEEKTTFATLELYDEPTQTLLFETAYPPSCLQKLRAKVGERRLIKREPGKRIGIAGRTTLERKPQLIPNVHNDPDYYQFLDSTCSELAVPLLDGDKVRGVLDVESSHPAAFDALHVKELETLAEIAVIAIHNAEQYKELEQTKRTAEASTALALMGMASSVWAHSIRGNAINIRELVDMMRQKLDLSDTQLSGMREEFDEKLARLERQATKILEKPLADPLLSEKGVGNFSIREILEERLTYLARNEAYREVVVESKLDAVDKSVTVYCNPEWLKRALDILLDNGVKAMKEMEPTRQLLTVRAEMTSDTADGEMVEIAVADTGSGIPPEVRDKFLKTRIDQPGDSSRSGVGLLMARTIVEAYGGRIELRHTGKEGTTIVIKLPVS